MIFAEFQGKYVETKIEFLEKWHVYNPDILVLSKKKILTNYLDDMCKSVFTQKWGIFQDNILIHDNLPGNSTKF